ncbi:MAG: SH3 domain-containing protein [Anaerolineaceae bacterium]|nr:SH3 domain-containing protein [Anaerolineaceae bacterium]
MMRHQPVIWIAAIALLVGALVLSVPNPGLAQSDAGMCPALVQQALTELGANCDSLARNSACYGYNRVDATFSESVPDNFFSTPADRSTLTQLDTIQTAPLDESLQAWGIAVLNVQANVPNTLPGQAVTFILLGDVEVENAVAPEDALQLAEPINVTTTTGANIRSGPTTRANVIGSVPENTELAADGLSADQDWLRVMYASGPGWISRQIITTDADITSLPVFTAESRTPMQSFYFRTGVGDPVCEESPPSLLVVQGPNDVKVDITANGADITIGSTIVLRLLPGNIIQLITISGNAEIGGINIPAGFTMTAQLSPDGKSIVGGWSDFRPLTDEELAELQPLEGIPGNLLHYAIVLPTAEDIQAALATFAQVNQSGGSVNAGPAAGQANCTNFKPTSPLGGLGGGMTAFYWDPAPGATHYQVNVYNENGANVLTARTSAPNTSLMADMSQAGNGFSFSWEVVALVNGQVACSANTGVMFREFVPPPTAAPTLTPAQICNATPGCSWDGACYCGGY